MGRLLILRKRIKKQRQISRKKELILGIKESRKHEQGSPCLWWSSEKVEASASLKNQQQNKSKNYLYFNLLLCFLWKMASLDFMDSQPLDNSITLKSLIDVVKTTTQNWSIVILLNQLLFSHSQTYKLCTQDQIQCSHSRHATLTLSLPLSQYQFSLLSARHCL